MKQDLSRAGARNRYDGRRRDHSHWPRNNGASKTSRGAAKPAANSLGTARTGGEPSITIDVSRATPMSATKRHARRRTAWSCIRRATTTPSSFTTRMGFFRTISGGSRDADRSAAGEGRLMFITLAALNRDQLIDLVKGREWAGYDRDVDPGDAVAQEDRT